MCAAKSAGLVTVSDGRSPVRHGGPGGAERQWKDPVASCSGVQEATGSAMTIDDPRRKTRCWALFSSDWVVVAPVRAARGGKVAPLRARLGEPPGEALPRQPRQTQTQLRRAEPRDRSRATCTAAAT